MSTISPGYFSARQDFYRNWCVNSTEEICVMYPLNQFQGQKLETFLIVLNEGENQFSSFHLFILNSITKE